MRKVIEKIKVFFAKVKTFWMRKVVPVLKKIVKIWKAFMVITDSKEFLYFFPLTVFALAGLTLRSTIFSLVFVVWLIPTLRAIIGKKEE
jgi:hypothetical protein